MQKIVKLAASCGECANYRYYSGGQHECSLVEQIVADKSIIAPFCPLADFPSRIIADMDMTIRTLREPNKYGLALALLSHIATKLKSKLSAAGVITITLKEEERVYLRLDAILEITTAVVIFVDGDKKYKLSPDVRPPQLHLQVHRDGFLDGLWQQVEIAS